MSIRSDCKKSWETKSSLKFCCCHTDSCLAVFWVAFMVFSKRYFKSFNLKDYVYVCMCVCLSECAPDMCRFLQRPENSVRSQEFEWQVVVNHLMWGAGKWSQFSARASIFTIKSSLQPSFKKLLLNAWCFHRITTYGLYHFCYLSHIPITAW